MPDPDQIEKAREKLRANLFVAAQRAHEQPLA